MSKSSNTLLSFLVGACLGALFGLLYAPEKGRSTRSKLSFQLDRYRGILHDFLGDLSRGEVSFENKAKKTGEAVMQSAKEKAEQLLGDVDALIDKIQ